LHNKADRRRRWLVALVAAVVLVVVLVLDRPVYLAAADPTKGVESGSLYQLFRLAGYLPTWVLIAAAMVLHDRSRIGGSSQHGQWWRRGGALLASAALSGLAAEVLKVVFRRERPLLHDGHMVFRSVFENTLSGSNLATPSSHAAVAFGGGLMLARLVPGTWPVLVLVGAGCGVTRIVSGAHFLSDVYLSAILGYAVSGVLIRWAADREQVGA
jgi:membrane-associated phospholipid phosphatase